MSKNISFRTIFVFILIKQFLIAAYIFCRKNSTSLKIKMCSFSKKAAKCRSHPFKIYIFFKWFFLRKKMFFCFFSCSMKNTAYEKNSIISYFIAGSSFLFRLEGSLLFVIKLKIDGGTFNAMIDWSSDEWWSGCWQWLGLLWNIWVSAV